MCRGEKWEQTVTDLYEIQERYENNEIRNVYQEAKKKKQKAKPGLGRRDRQKTRLIERLKIKQHTSRRTWNKLRLKWNKMNLKQNLGYIITNKGEELNEIKETMISGS